MKVTTMHCYISGMSISVDKEELGFSSNFYVFVWMFYDVMSVSLKWKNIMLNKKRF